MKPTMSSRMKMPFDAVAEDLVLRLEPVDDDPRAEIDEPMAALRVLDQFDHEVRRAADEPGRAERARARDERQDVAVIEDALLRHAVAMQRERGERVGFDFVFRELVDVLEPIERVVLARRVVLPELDLRAEHDGSAAIRTPSTRRDEDDVGVLPHDLQVRLEPELGSR
jgi:hypothetical protein